MDKLFERNKTFFAIIISALIIGGAIYFSGNKLNLQNSNKENYLNSNSISNQEEPSSNCSSLPDLLDRTTKLVTKVIDGDTFIIEGGYSVRILGIDADERGYPCYEEAKNRLEELVLSKEVILEKGMEDKDKWCRYLRYVFINGRNISEELVKEGLAVARFSSDSEKYEKEIREAEKYARTNKIGCKWSPQTSQNKNEIKEAKCKRLKEESIGLKVVYACDAKNYFGKEIIVEGKIVDTYRSKTNTIFLDFENFYPKQCFTGVIFSSDQYKFIPNPEKYYLNQIVRIKGIIKEYKGQPEIILKDPSQIEICN